MVRLTQHEREIIQESVLEQDADAIIYLFGSRVDEQALGGDIDLLIHSQTLNKSQIRKIKWRLLEMLGEQKIDIIVSKTLQEAFVKLIFSTAIKLQ